MRLFPILPALCAMLAACASQRGPGAHAGEPYLVSAQRTLFYTYGPAQATGPDFVLARGQRLTMLSYDYGYSHITIPDTGQSGYVPTEDLVPAPPKPPAPHGAASPAGSPGRRHSSATSRPPAPGEQVTVPLPEFPESEPPPWAPPFRY